MRNKIMKNIIMQREHNCYFSDDTALISVSDTTVNCKTAKLVNHLIK